jgi:hypothetical protein
MPRPARSLFLILSLGAAGCGRESPVAPDTENRDLGLAANAARIPLTDNPGGLYFTFKRGLYNGSNTVPAKHHADGLAAARRIRPLDASGAPDPNGSIVVLSIGMSSASQEFCGKHSLGGVCNAWTFAGRAMADPQKSPAVVLVNGADGGQSASLWESPTAANYSRVEGVLAAQNVTPEQVQVIWLKVVNISPTVALPSASADAYNLERSMGNILRTLKTVYPNLQQVFLMSRIYAGYTSLSNNPEPYAYESGFAAKWVIEAQVRQMLNGTIDANAGNLDHRTVAPWVAWGPYLWANGTRPRQDGMTWTRSEFESDGFHPSPSGETKIGLHLYNFFTQSPYTSCWYHGVSC